MARKLLHITSALAGLLLLLGCTGVPFLPQLRPSFAEIPIPDTVLPLESVTRLKVTDLDGPVSTKNQAAVMWLDTLNGSPDYDSSHVGLLDVEEGQIKELRSVNGGANGYLLWSPDGTRFIYGNQMSGVGVIVYQVNSPTNPHILYDAQDSFGVRCEWGPSEDGRYIVCDENMTHEAPPDLKVYDTSTWKQICTIDPFDLVDTCRPLPLVDGRWWHLVSVGPGVETVLTDSPIPPPYTGPYREKLLPIHPAMDELCNKYRRFSDCNPYYRDPTGRFAAFAGSEDLYVVGAEPSQFWKVAESRDRHSYLSGGWSADGRYLLWSDSGQLGLFDTENHTRRGFILPDAMVGLLAWSPLH